MIPESEAILESALFLVEIRIREFGPGIGIGIKDFKADQIPGIRIKGLGLESE